MTYLELVNEVLIRLRENPVTSVNATKYSKLVGLWVNDAKRNVEDAWGWSVNDVSIPLVTTPGVTDYTVVGSGMRQKDVTVNNTETGSKNRLTLVPPRWITDQLQLTTVASARTAYYAWTGNDGTDSTISIYPIPDAAYTLVFNMNVPQVKLINDSDVLLVPSEPVIAGAYARGLVERGEDGAMNSSEAYALYRSILADYIAMESTRDISNEVWVAN